MIKILYYDIIYDLFVKTQAEVKPIVVLPLQNYHKARKNLVFFLTLYCFFVSPHPNVSKKLRFFLPEDRPEM